MLSQSDTIAAKVQEALTEATTPEKIKELISAEIDKAVKHAVKESVNWSSPFVKKLEAEVGKALQLNTLDLTAYNLKITCMVQRLVEQHVSQLIEGRLKKDVADLLKIAPKEITLSTIVEDMTEDREGVGDVTCWVEEREPNMNCFGPRWTIYLDEDNAYSFEDRQMATCQIWVLHGLKADDATEEDLRTGTIGSLFEHGASIAGKGKFTHRNAYGLIARLLALYASETVITIDEENVVTSYGYD